MEWLNVHVPILRAPEYIGSEPVARATWFNVSLYCVEQENGGRIVGGAKWKDRQWQQTCGVTLLEVESASLLLTIDGDDILVWRYPIEKEQEVRAKREAGAKGGRTKAENRQKQDSSCATSTTPSCASSKPPSCASTERNGKEEEGKENGKEGDVGGSAEDFMKAWNNLPDPFPKIRVMSDTRKQHLRARLRDSFWRDNWLVAMAMMPGVPFLRGEGRDGWIADVDFFLGTRDAVLKIVEGKYVDRKPANGRGDELEGFTMVDPLAHR